MATSGTFSGSNNDEAAVFAFVLEPSSTPPPVNDGTAATAFGWGTPLGQSDEFEYTGSPNSTKWSVLSGAGRDGKGTRSPARATVSNGKLVLDALATGETAALEQKFDQQYGRWEIRARAVESAPAPGTGGGSSQTLGVGGVATPPGAIVATGDTTARLNIGPAQSGTAGNPRVYDGKGFSVGRITISAGTSYVTVQNYRVNADGQYAIYVNPPGSGSKSHHITIQNNDVRNIHGPGDLNAITIFGDDIKILFNTVVDNWIVGDPGGSHSDCIQSWNNDPNESSSRVWIIGNKFTAPRQGDGNPIHQCIMAQGKAATDGGGGGTGDSTDWYISDNEFAADWNQDVKLEDIDNSVVTRNRFTGASTRAIEIRSSSSNTRFYSDNVVGSGYGSVGATITAGAGPPSPLGNTSGPDPVGASYHPILAIRPAATTGGGGGTGTTTGGTGGPLTDRTNVAYANPAGTSSVGHIYAGGLDWSKPVGLLFYTDGSGEFGLKNLSSTYLMAGTNGLIAVAKKHNMILVTPLAPGGGCDDGDGTCWYDSSGSMNIPTKIKWADDFIRNMVLTKYNIDTSRVVISGYSSGAQFTSEYYGPQYAWAWMTDGLLLSISYGGSPKVTAGYPTAFKQKVAAVWDVGANDSAYQGDGNFDAQSGYDAYVSLGFTTTELNVVPGLGHNRDGQFGAVVDREITQHVSAGTASTPTGDGGEYDFFETAVPGGQPVQAFLRYPRDTTLPVQQETFSKSPVDTSQFHNYAFEWTPDHVKGFIDGEQWFVAGGGATATRRNLQAMLSGHLAILLDNFDGTTQNPASFEVEWARVYSLTPSGGGTGPQTISPVGIPSREAFGTALVTGGNTSPPPGSVPTLLGVNTVLGSSTLGHTQGEGEPPPPGTQIVRPFGIPTGQAFGLPQVTVPDGPPFLAVVGIPSAAAFGRPTVIAGPPVPPAPGGVLVPALYAVGSDGTTLTPISSWTKIRVSPVRNSAGSLTIEYPAGAPGFQLLHDSVSASPLRALEIRLWLGGNNTFALGGWLVQKSGDDLTPGSSWQFTGHFHEWLLTKAIIGPQAISEANKTGSLNFAGANPGLILTTIMDQAQARGALPYMTRDFTTTHDSNGQAWAKSISSLKLAPKTTVFDVVNKLFELGMCEFEVTPGRIWRVFNPEGQGTDRTLGGSPLIFAQARNLSEHARRESSRDAGTAVLVAGSEGFYKFVSSATAQAQLGWRAEVGADAGQLTSQAAVDAVAESYLEKARAGVAEYSSAIEFGPGERLPMIDYRVGDWAYTSTTSGRRRLRIAQIELEFGVGAPPRGKVVQNDLITDRLTALYRKLAAISTGDAVVGTSEPTPGGLGEDTNPPAAPIGVTVSSSFAYQIPGDATTYAEVAVGWQAVNTNLYADEVIAGKVRAAEIIGGRLRAAADPIFEDWTWGDAPEIVTLHNDALLEEWEADPSNPGGDDNTFSAEALAWLTAYPASKQGGGAITADVSHYVVQYQYLGQSGTGGFFDPRNPDAEFGFWGTAEGSPTPNTLLIFGGVTGGRAVGVRVAAVDNAGNQGPFSDVVGTTTAVDDIPPPAPSKPTVKGGFRTVQVTWDGKGSSGEDMVLAAADILSGGGVEIHIAEGIDFTPERPVGPNGKVDLALSSTYQNTFYDAGSLTFAGFENGVTYFARLVAVDRNGNASDPSETSDGATPNKLVTIDYGPDTIDRATIKAAAIGSAEIDLLAVNEQHVGTVNASSIVSGLMQADVTVSGRFSTPISSTGNQLEFDSAGIRLSRGGSIVGRWQVFDASMLVTGQYQTAMTGSRLVINPGSSQPDTMRFYPTFTDAYSSIDSVDFAGGTIAGIRIIGSANSTTANAGMMLIRDQYASIVHGRRDLSYWGSEIWVEQAFTRNKSAAVDLIVDERLTSQFGPRRVAMIHYNSNGQPINATGLYYKKTGAFGGEPMLYANGQDVGIVFGGTDGVTSSRVLVRSNDNTQFREIAAGAFTLSSSQEVKYGIRGLDTDPVQHLRQCAPKHFRRHGDLDADPERLGFIAEEMPNEVRQSIQVQQTDGGPPEVIETIDLAAVMALDWAATQQIEKRLSAVERWIKGKKEPNA